MPRGPRWRENGNGFPDVATPRIAGRVLDRYVRQRTANQQRQSPACNPVPQYKRKSNDRNPGHWFYTHSKAIKKQALHKRDLIFKDFDKTPGYIGRYKFIGSAFKEFDPINQPFKKVSDPVF